MVEFVEMFVTTEVLNSANCEIVFFFDKRMCKMLLETIDKEKENFVFLVAMLN